MAGDKAQQRVLLALLLAVGLHLLALALVRSWLPAPAMPSTAGTIRVMLTAQTAANPPPAPTRVLAAHGSPAKTTTGKALGRQRSVTPKMPATAVRPGPLQPVRPTAIRPGPSRPVPAGPAASLNATAPAHNAVATAAVDSPYPAATSTAPITAAARPSDEPRTARQVTEHLRRLLAPQFEYPRLARRRGWQGEVKLGMHVSPSGQLSAVRLVATSGHALLDRAALQTVERIATVPSAAAFLQGTGVDVILPVHYRLLEG